MTFLLESRWPTLHHLKLLRSGRGLRLFQAASRTDVFIGPSAWSHLSAPAGSVTLLHRTPPGRPASQLLLPGRPDDTSARWPNRVCADSRRLMAPVLSRLCWLSRCLGKEALSFSSALVFWIHPKFISPYRAPQRLPTREAFPSSSSLPRPWSWPCFLKRVRLRTRKALRRRGGRRHSMWHLGLICVASPPFDRQSF